MVVRQVWPARGVGLLIAFADGVRVKARRPRDELDLGLIEEPTPSSDSAPSISPVLWQIAVPPRRCSRVVQ
jgi:hypothetical protein